MTEKRFRISQGYSDKFCHDWEKNELLNFKQTIDYLNTFYEENEQLKKENKEYIRGLELRKVECQSWASDVRELREQNCQLEKENEQLKKENKELEDEIEKLENRLWNCQNVR